MTDFENLVMHEDETITDFHGRLCDVSNECYALGKVYSNSELVRKVVCSLPKRFMSKVTSIEECRDLDSMELDELIGSLQTFELNLKRWENKKPSKGLALKHEVDSERFENVDTSTLDDDTCALLTKNFAKFLKKNAKHSFGDKKGKQPFVKKISDQQNLGSFPKRLSKDKEKRK